MSTNNIIEYGRRADAAEAELREAGFTQIDELRGAINAHVNGLIASIKSQAGSNFADQWEEVDYIEYDEGTTAASAFAKQQEITDERILNLIRNFGWHYAVLVLHLELESLDDQMYGESSFDEGAPPAVHFEDEDAGDYDSDEDW